jgi:hypothetical protein
MSGLLNPHLRHDGHGDAMLARLKATHPGQADFADLSLGETCGGCVHWDGGSERGNQSGWGAAVKKRACLLRCSIMREPPPKRGPLLIPPDQCACPKWEAAP